VGDMPQSYDIFFASSNVHKYEEAEKILSEFGIRLGFFQTELVEIQDDSLSKIALQKSLNAYEKCKKPVIIEDDGLFIDSLSGFPGPYSSYIFNTIGNNGILKLIGDNRDAQFVAIIAFCDSSNEPILFESSETGTISKNIQDGSWGYDPIFIPENQTKTYAELDDKNKLSHRYKALKQFALRKIIIDTNTALRLSPVSFKIPLFPIVLKT
jgi:XTP/dITP diphosphohydrolase